MPVQDQLVRERLLQLTPGLPADVLGRWVYDDYLGWLADVANLTEPALVLYLDWLRERLNETQYRPKSVATYKRIWKSIATEKAKTRRAAQLAAHGEREAAGGLPPRFAIKERAALSGDIGDQACDPFSTNSVEVSTTAAIFNNVTGQFLTNFILQVDEEVQIHDSHEGKKTLLGCTLKIHDRETTFRIDAHDFSDDHALKAAIHEAGGSRVVIHGRVNEVREAISVLSWSPPRQPRRRAVTTDFGWTADGTAYLVPGGVITADGFTLVSGTDMLDVDLNAEEHARYLGLLPPGSAAELLDIKRHVAQDLLQLHQRRIMFSLLGAMAAAVLAPLVPEADPFLLWLVGLTGAGKSFLARLFLNFFGDFLEGTGRIPSWNSTANFLQRQGYYFKDALYLIDDFKPEVTRHQDVVRILQNYSDRAGRGRLKVDATTNTSRPIRGLLVSTGEDIPEHTPSAVARSIIVPVPQQVKRLDLGQRCLLRSKDYRRLTADFVRYILTADRKKYFHNHYFFLKKHIYREIAGAQNDGRIAGNFALLGAALGEAALYLSDVWPEGEMEAAAYVNEDLYELRQGMLSTVREQQPSEVFWATLSTLLQHEVVAVESRSSQNSHTTFIGKSQRGNDNLVFISTELALAAVNNCLREQGRPELKMTFQTLLAQLRREGRLLDTEGQPIPADSKLLPPPQTRIAGNPKRGFITSKVLLGLERATAPLTQAHTSES